MTKIFLSIEQDLEQISVSLFFSLAFEFDAVA